MTRPEHSTTVVIFIKAPVPGFAKTRLIPVLGADGAARLAQRMIEDTLATVITARIGPVELCITPAITDLAWREYGFPTEFTISDQGDGDLGARMARAAQRILESGERVLLIGTDCIDMTDELLREAANALDKVDAVLYPAEDGGYVLLGLRRFDETLFTSIAWSTPEVCATTLDRIQALNWSMLVGKTLRDLDEPEDLGLIADYSLDHRVSTS
jgi:uncharacterized protein